MHYYAVNYISDLKCNYSVRFFVCAKVPFATFTVVQSVRYLFLFQFVHSQRSELEELKLIFHLVRLSKAFAILKNRKSWMR